MPEVAADEAKRLIDSGAQVIDIRTDEEWESGRIPGARHIKLADLPSSYESLDQSKPVVVYCRAGNRSGPAADAFAASGWEASSIEGGLVAWSEAGYDLDPEGGSVAENPNMPPR